MNVNDKRKITKNLVPFKELSIGEVQEDEDSYICIKTAYAGCEENNCIALIDGDWEVEYQDLNSKVVRVEAELILKGNK